MPHASFGAEKLKLQAVFFPCIANEEQSRADRQDGRSDTLNSGE